MKYKKLIQRFLSLRFIQDRKDHHPEANVLEHSLQAYHLAKKESFSSYLWAAALLHDVGKSICTLGHDELSIDIIESFGYNNPDVFWLIRNHIRIISFLDGNMKKRSKVDELLFHPLFKTLIHLRRIDTSARNPNKLTKVDDDLIYEINDLLEMTNGN